MERVSSALAGGFFPTSAAWEAGLLPFLLPRMEAAGETAWELLLGAGVCSPCLHGAADHWRVLGDCLRDAPSADALLGQSPCPQRHSASVVPLPKRQTQDLLPEMERVGRPGSLCLFPHPWVPRAGFT